jgi:hypothetical protein
MAAAALVDAAAFDMAGAGFGIRLDRCLAFKGSLEGTETYSNSATLHAVVSRFDEFGPGQTGGYGSNTVISPPDPGNLCAFGLHVCDVTRDYIRTLVRRQSSADADEIIAAWRELDA